MTSSFVSLPGCGKGAGCFLLTQLKDGGKEGFSLMLTDGEKCWDGQLTEEDLDALSGNLKMDFNTYVSQTVKAFTRRDMADLNFVYQVKPQAEGIVDLTWKKEVAGDIKVKMGSVPLYLKTNSAQSMREIFTSCIDMMADLHGRIRTLESDNQRLSQERQNALKRLDKCVSAKEDLEKDLYSKFVAVLNSKKEKIRSIQNGYGDNAESMEAEPSASTSDAAGSRKRGRAAAATHSPEASDDSGAEGGRAVIQSSDEDGRNTDEETPPKRQRGPVRMAKKDADSSLALGDDDKDDAADDDKTKAKGVVKRPARQRGGNKRQTPSKPVLPKVSSRSSDVGIKTPQRSSMRKSGSGHSDRSADNLDTDDLLNDF